ncbi:hypothetical protein OPT61_g7725 [Boeremia exigua]|uniref:Uncharacterized protein n=1 Tax=Boeremia exigua TaxID=749465 RepID=A0ACC2I2D0_9PLEO|nr:hypothetical protein OPT61_g7725 [Boeremia exigua]
MPKITTASSESNRVHPLRPKQIDTRTRRKESNPGSYLFRVSIDEVHDPIIERYLCVPYDFSFLRFATVLINACGWSRDPFSERLWSFEIRTTDGQTLQDDAEFKDDAADIAIAMGRTPDDIRVARSWSLRKMFEQHLQTGSAPLYIEFEYGARWDHRIELLGMASPTERADRGFPEKQQVFCYEGHGHPISETCRGVEAWTQMKALFADPVEKDGLDVRDYYKHQSVHGFGGLDPYAYCPVLVNSKLKYIAR